MKNFARILALLLVATMLCVMLASCGTPAEDPKEAKKALKDADYEVTLIDDEDVLEYYDYDGLEAILYASKIDPEIDLDDKDEDWEELDGETVTYEYIVIYYFEDEGAAEDAFKDLEDELNDEMEWEADYVADETNENNDALNVEVEVKFDWKEATLDGCMIYVGTTGALSDAS